MRLTLNKFGKILISRPAGREAWLSAKAYLLPPKNSTEKIEVDFSGVEVFSPSWADEFITPLQKTYPGKIIILPYENSTVKETLEIIKLKP